MSELDTPSNSSSCRLGRNGKVFLLLTIQCEWHTYLGNMTSEERGRKIHQHKGGRMPLGGDVEVRVERMLWKTQVDENLVRLSI